MQLWGSLALVSTLRRLDNIRLTAAVARIATKTTKTRFREVSSQQTEYIGLNRATTRFLGIFFSILSFSAHSAFALQWLYLPIKIYYDSYGRIATRASVR